MEKLLDLKHEEELVFLSDASLHGALKKEVEEKMVHDVASWFEQDNVKIKRLDLSYCCLTQHVIGLDFCGSNFQQGISKIWWQVCVFLWLSHSHRSSMIVHVWYCQDWGWFLTKYPESLSPMFVIRLRLCVLILLLCD